MNFYILAGVVFVVLIFVSVIRYRDTKNKLAKIADNRIPMEPEDFVAHFVSKGYRKEIVLRVREEVSVYLGLDWFSIHPEDDLVKDLDIDVEDLEDIVRKIAVEFGLGTISHEDNMALNEEFDGVTTEYVLESLRRRKN